MKRIIIAAITAATLITPAAASAAVDRHQTQTAAFTVTQPSGAGGLWTHDFKVSDNPCDDSDEFTGSAVVTGLDYDGPKTLTETFEGTFDKAANTVSFVSKRDHFYVDGWQLVNAKTDGVTENVATSYPTVSWQLAMKVTKPVFTESNYKNHGQYVKAMGGGYDAAHSCIGMPITSSK